MAITFICRKKNNAICKNYVTVVDNSLRKISINDKINMPACIKKVMLTINHDFVSDLFP